MITDRDREVFKYLEKYRAISSQQARWIFFDGLETSSIRRLNNLEERAIIKSYHVGKHKVYAYNEAKEISEHDLLILDFYAWVYRNGGEVIEFTKEPRYFNGLLRPDALVKCKIPYNDVMYEMNFILEVDFKHYTENTKIAAWYTKLCSENVVEDFILVIARPTPGIRYNSKNFKIIYTDLQYNNLLRIIFQGQA